MARLTGREIDYTQTEMLKKTNLSRKQFVDCLKNICETYNINYTDFKVEKDNEDSKFFFIPEVAELLSILLRNYHKNPFQRKNFNIENVTSTDMKEYYESILEDIDKLNTTGISNQIYELEGYLVNRNVIDWMERIIRQLTYFLINISSLPEQDLGESMKQFTKKLEQMNYYLFKGNKVKAMAIDSNIAELINNQLVSKNDDMVSLNKRLNQNNTGIDRLIALLIKVYLKKSNMIRESNFSQYEFNSRFLHTMCIDLKKLSIDEKRELYLFIETCDYYQTLLLENKREMIRNTVWDNNNWESITEKIKKGTFHEVPEKKVDDQIEMIENEIKCLESEIELKKKILVELRKLKDENKTVEVAREILKGIQSQYVKHCEYIDSNNDYDSIRKTVDKFVVKAIYEMLK